jgi:exodeoxyribonuclease-5
MDEDGREVLTFSARLRSGELRGRTVLIDESSMVTADIVKDLLALGVRIVAFGDPGQLPPVSGEPGFPYAEIELWTVHRQAAGSPIIRQAHAVRDGKQYVDDGDAFRVLKPGEKADIANMDIVLCFKNDTRHRLNTLCRRRLGVGDGLARAWPCAGEPVIVTRNVAKLDLWNGTVGVLAEDIDPWDRDALLVVEDTNGTRRVNVPHVWFEGFHPVEARGQWSTPMSFGYASTVHRAQGSEWERVLVVDEYPLHDSERTRWLYTSLTRAASQVIVKPQALEEQERMVRMLLEVNS